MSLFSSLSLLQLHRRWPCHCPIPFLCNKKCLRNGDTTNPVGIDKFPQEQGSFEDGPTSETPSCCPVGGYVPTRHLLLLPAATATDTTSAATSSTIGINRLLPKAAFQEHAGPAPTIKPTSLMNADCLDAVPYHTIPYTPTPLLPRMPAVLTSRNRPIWHTTQSKTGITPQPSQLKNIFAVHVIVLDPVHKAGSMFHCSGQGRRSTFKDLGHPSRVVRRDDLSLRQPPSNLEESHFRTWPIVVGTAMFISRNVDRHTRALDFLGHHPLPTILLYDECKLSMRTSIRIATAQKCSNCLIRSQPTNRAFLVRHIFQRRGHAQVSQPDTIYPVRFEQVVQ